MIRRWIRDRLPQSQHFDRYPITRRFKPWLSHPGLWAINRRSVAGGVAAGLFCGLIPGPFQIGGTIVWCLAGKVNLPVAIVTTFYTNPVSIVPLYLFAIAYGHLLLGTVEQGPMPALPEWDWTAFWQSTVTFFEWMLNLGPSLAVGLPATMVTFSVLGYVGVRLAWNIGLRVAVVKRRRKSLKRQQAT